MSRTIIWFSCGATSAVAAKLALAEYPEALVVRIVITSEHEDSNRFADDVQSWLGKEITNLSPKRFHSHFDVLEHYRYVNGPYGAKCTKELKRDVRAKFELPDDLHVFGFDAGEADRVEDFREQNPTLNFAAPLIAAGLTKSDCLEMLQRAGIEIPMMYKLGYSNSNCLGCVKGGMGYWNKIRIDFPEQFARMARLERTIGKTVLRRNGVRIFLDELDPEAGRDQKPVVPDCSILCEVALNKVGL